MWIFFWTLIKITLQTLRSNSSIQMYVFWIYKRIKYRRTYAIAQLLILASSRYTCVWIYSNDRKKKTRKFSCDCVQCTCTCTCTCTCRSSHGRENRCTENDPKQKYQNVNRFSVVNRGKFKFRSELCAIVRCACASAKKKTSPPPHHSPPPIMFDIHKTNY